MRKKFKNILTVMIFFIFCLLFYSEKWFLDTWDSSIDFSTVVYQLFSPLKGTGGEIVKLYIRNCVYPALLTVVVGLFFYKILCGFRQKLLFLWRIEAAEINICVRSDFPCKKAFRNLSKDVVLCIMCGLIWKQAVTMGIIDYIKVITQRSVIFEEEYVDPKETVLSFPKNKRNLVLIYLESMETTYASSEDGGGKPQNYIPELTKLAFDNVYFSNDTDLGGFSSVTGTGWTMGALLASSSGVPYKLGISGNTAGNYEKFLPGIVTLGDILQEQGYQNYFMCGSDASYAGREDFYAQHGNYTFIDLNKMREEGIVPGDYDNGFWGIEDEKLFTSAKAYLSNISKKGQPFNFTLLTVDTHHPDGWLCDLCESKYEQQYANVLACSSRLVFDFVKWMQEQDWYENTTIVITGDHLSMKSDFWDDLIGGGYEREVYNCFINLPDNLVPARTKNRTFTILDLFPSILAAMDVKIEGERLGLGVNLFSKEMTIPEKIGLVEFDTELGYYSEYYFRHFIVEK